MFDSVAFNVVIGLVLIYLLYSLLVTIVSEIISTAFGMRARVLRVAIERMLNDGYYSVPREKNWWYRIRVKLYKTPSDFVSDQSFLSRLLLRPHEKFKTSFAGRFYEYPSIKYLSQLESDQKGLLGQTKPAYISAETFANTLINMFLDKGRGADKLEQIRFCLHFNTWHIQPETLQHLRNVLSNYGNDINTFRDGLVLWFNETMDRTNGWYKSKLRLILFFFGLSLAICFNIDSVRIVHILSTDKQARADLVKMGVAISQDTAMYQNFVHSNGDSVRSSAILDTGFSKVTKDIGAANYILGLGWGLDTLTTNSKKEVDKNDDTTKYNDLQSLEQEQTALKTLKDTLERDLILRRKSADSLNNLAWVGRMDSAIKVLEAPASMLKIVGHQYQVYLYDQDRQLKTKLLTIREDTIRLIFIQREFKTLTDSVNGLLATQFKSIDSIKPVDLTFSIYGRNSCSPFQKIGYFIKSVLHPITLLGLIITALALSLGAPFWFDLLNNLMSIRGAGVKPEEKDPIDPATQPNPKLQPLCVGIGAVTTPIITDQIDQLISIHGAALKAIPGVKSLFKLKSATGYQLQINVTDQATESMVTTQLRTLLPNVPSGLYCLKISGTPTPHLAPPGSIGISNASGLNGFGSLGCVLLDTTTQKRHILSCWHVLKGNTQYDTDDSLFTIWDSNSNTLAKRWAGGIQGPFDFGIAELDPAQAIYTNASQLRGLTAGNPKYRPLTNADINNQISIQYLNCFTGQLQPGFILCDTASVEITYEDKTRNVEDVLVLTSAKTPPQQTISQAGNSGALVLDSAGVAIGLVIAGDLNYTYAMKLSNFFGLHNEMKITI